MSQLRSVQHVHALPRLVLHYRRLHKARATFLRGVAHHLAGGVVRPTWYSLQYMFCILSICLLCRFFLFSFTLHSVYSREDRRNLVLRHSIPHFPSNFRGIAHTTLRFAFLSEGKNEHIHNNNSFLRLEIESTIVAFTVTRLFHCSLRETKVS